MRISYNNPLIESPEELKKQKKNEYNTKNYTVHSENKIFENNNINNNDQIKTNQRKLYIDFDKNISNYNSIDILNKNFLNNGLNNKLNIKIDKINTEIKKHKNELEKLNNELTKKIDNEKDYILVINWLEIIIKVTAVNLKEKQPLQLTTEIVDDYITNYLSKPENNNQTGGFNPIIEKGKNILKRFF
jgi:hypothetical protein